MSRSRVLTLIVVTLLAPLVAGGATAAVASPHAVVAKKHHHKKKKRKKAKSEQKKPAGGTATSCTGTIANGIDPRFAMEYYYAFHCNGSFTQFTLTTNKTIQQITYAVWGGGSGHKLTCQAGTLTVTCSGVPPSGNPKISVYYTSNDACATPTMLSSSVKVNGKTSSLSATCN